MAGVMGGAMRRWWMFLAERFPLGSHIPMVMAFVAGNIGIARRIFPAEPSLTGSLAAFLIALAFFLRLRCFDEIKDLEVDRQVNPDRPLARGLLEVSEVRRVIGGLMVFEVALAAMHWPALPAYILAAVYSLLMYREFFIGRWLRSHLTTYAVAHTFVSALLALTIIALAYGVPPWQWPGAAYYGAALNWCMFNLFEFGRKTFAPGEERPRVESYSSLFGAWGAVALSLSQVGAALMLLARLQSIGIELALATAPLGAAFFYALVRTNKSAAIYRGVVSTFLLLFYTALAWPA